VARPLLGLLGATQAAVLSDDEVGLLDAEALARQEADRAQRSLELAELYASRFGLAGGIVALERVAKELTPQVKGQLAGNDLARVRKAYGTRLAQLKAEGAGVQATNGQTQEAPWTAPAP
jgi:hypothetical protein